MERYIISFKFYLPTNRYYLTSYCSYYKLTKIFAQEHTQKMPKAKSMTIITSIHIPAPHNSK